MFSQFFNFLPCEQAFSCLTVLKTIKKTSFVCREELRCVCQKNLAKNFKIPKRNKPKCHTEENMTHFDIRKRADRPNKTVRVNTTKAVSIYKGLRLRFMTSRTESVEATEMTKSSLLLTRIADSATDVTSISLSQAQAFTYRRL
ncbi:hypothetical protein GWK47_039079 [Chionoecetes opilio]|uniref:Uncharacterized protein n=1 Tax=Chionoecetes opilio TaxID=41210 RepID=A0A8J4YKN6_CHIOP|nr:hypothetical protein GWK47_039079 [Chionoecetes opilio]